MKRFLNKDILLDLFFIFILSLTPLLWFKKDTLMVGHDNVFPLNPSVFLDGRLFSWIELGFGRSQALIMGTIPIHFIDAIPYLLGFPLQITQKIVYIFWFFLMGVSTYILASVINRESRYFKLTAVVFYIFNFFILQAWWIAERTKFSAYIAFPLVLAIFLKVYRNDLRVIKGAILTSLVLFIFNGGGLFGISLYGGFFIAISVFVAFFSLISIHKKEFFAVKRILLLTMLSIFGFLIVNSYYIFPALSQIALRYQEGVQKSGGLSGFVDWASEISANASYSNLMRFQGIAEWYDNPEHPYSKIFLNNPFFIFASFLWPLLIFLTILLTKRSKLKIVIYFSIVYLLGVFFAAGTHPPFGFLYALFIKYVPGAVSFRSPYFKFAPAIFLAASFLIAFFVDHFEGKKKKIIFFLIILIALAYHFPYFTGNFFEWRRGFSTRNQIPDYVFKFGQWAEEEMDNDSRVLLLPPSNSNWQYDIYKWGYLSLQALPTLVTNRGIVSNDDKVSNDEMMLLENLYEAIDKKDILLTQKLSEALGINYFLLRHDFESDLESISTKNPKFYKEVLENDFKFLPKKEFDKWILYGIFNNRSSKFIFTDRINILNSQDKKIENYYELSNNNSNFIFNSNLSSSIGENLSNFIIPECLNCRHELSPPINFPKRMILPGSVFYPIVKYKERKEIENLSPREAVYADLGHSLKRVGEILATLDQGKKIDSSLLFNYLEGLKRIEKDFNNVNIFKDKFETSEDINYYLKPQKNYLYRLMGVKINEKETIRIGDEIFEEIVKIEKIVDPYLFKDDISNNRLYQFNLESQGSYEIFVKKEDLTGFSKEETMKLLLDGKEKKELKMENDFKNKWLSFGKFDLSLGDHKLLLSLPSLPNLIDNFHSEEYFGKKVGNNCYEGSIRNYNNKKVYKLKIGINNDFSEQIYYYEVKTKNGKELIDNIAKLEKHFEQDNLEALIYSSKDSSKILMYLCSANMNEAVSQNKIKINVTEVIHSDLMIKPLIEPKSLQIDLNYKKISPTEYIVDIKNDRPGIMIFNGRFDLGWKLSDFDKNHFKVNGYENGWYLDKTGQYQLTLEYLPQNYFYFGMIVSLISILAGLTYLFKTKR